MWYFGPSHFSVQTLCFPAPKPHFLFTVPSDYRHSLQVLVICFLSSPLHIQLQLCVPDKQSTILNSYYMMFFFDHQHGTTELNLQTPGQTHLSVAARYKIFGVFSTTHGSILSVFVPCLTILLVKNLTCSKRFTFSSIHNRLTTPWVVIYPCKFFFFILEHEHMYGRSLWIWLCNVLLIVY